MKVCVYGIAKNESKFVERFVESAKDADYVCVLDTGSDDGTAELLTSLGVIARTQEIKPWRFDAARILSMELIPDDTDICICMDMDEVLCEGWRESIEAQWGEHTTRGRHRLIWSHDKYGNPAIEYLSERVHKYGMYTWEHIVHETLVPIGQETCIEIADFTVEHFPDANKPRTQYLHLLEQDFEERPNDDRTAHYLGREYMFQGDYVQAIQQLERHLAMPNATWAEERSASMRYAAKSYEALGLYDAAQNWLYRACAESSTREPLVDMAAFQYRRGNMYGTAYFANAALQITNKQLNYITSDEAWSALPHDLLAVASWYLGDKKTAKEQSRIACQLNPDDARLQMNMLICEEG